MTVNDDVFTLSLRGESVSDPQSHTEEARLRRLAEYGIARTPPEPVFDEIAQLAANLLEMPIAFIGIAEAQNHWFKACVGMRSQEMPRSNSVSDYALAGDSVFCVPDATQDPRFAALPHVTDDRHVRFFAVVPLVDSEGFRLGTLGVADRRGRNPLTAQQEAALASLGRITVDRLELRRVSAQIAESEAKAQAATAVAEAAHAKLRDALELLPEAILITDAEDRVTLWNQRYVDLFPEVAKVLAPGLAFEKLLRTSVREGQYFDDSSSESVEIWIARRLAGHRARRDTFEKRLRDGRYIRYDQRATSDGGAICIRVDITQIRQSEESFRALFDENPLPMMVYDVENLKFLDVNKAALKHFGLSKENYLSMTHLELQPPEFRGEAEAILRARKGRKSGEDAVLWKSDGTRFIASLYSRPLDYQGYKASLATFVDVTDQRRHEEQIEHVAHHDALSGLPNRLAFNKELDNRLLHISQPGVRFSLVLIDIDYFKKVNDTLGHHVGDQLIIETGKRIRNSIGGNDFLARLGGDEFAIILSASDPVAEIDRLASMMSIMAVPLSIDGHRVVSGISVGVTLAPRDASDSTTLMQNADLALYRAKATGRGRFCHFQPEMRSKALGKLALERDLRRAVTNSEFVLHYQPMVEFGARRVTGYEALLRWKHPKRGILSPSEFMSGDESEGPFLSISAWGLAEACKEAMTWKEALNIAVNFSAAQFQTGEIVRTVEQALAVSNLDPRRLELEITELLLLDQNPGVFTNLSLLRDLGVTVTMDDFGTGYSSLGSLPGFPIDKIKIDHSLVSGLTTKPHCLEIVRAVLAVGNSLNVRVMAEGVETEAEFLALRELGCREGQGYLFGRPMLVPGAEPAEFLRGAQNDKHTD